MEEWNGEIAVSLRRAQRNSRHGKQKHLSKWVPDMVELYKHMWDAGYLYCDMARVLDCKPGSLRVYASHFGFGRLCCFRRRMSSETLAAFRRRFDAIKARVDEDQRRRLVEVGSRGYVRYNHVEA